MVALDLIDAGLIEMAAMVASAITILPSAATEGYQDTWQNPAQDDVTVN